MKIMHLHLSGRLEVFLLSSGDGQPYTAQYTTSDSQYVGHGVTPRDAILDALSGDRELDKEPRL